MTVALTDRDGPDRSPVVSPDGRRVAYLGFDDRVRTFQNTRLSVRDLEGGPTRVIGGDLDRSLGNITWGADGHIYATYLDRGMNRLMRVDLEGEITELTDALGGLAIGRPYTSGAYSVSDGGTVAYTHGTALRPSDVAVLEDGETRVLTDLNSDLLDHRALGDVEEITWQAPDGLEIQGWIVRPPNAEPGRQYPMLVENHGGPIAAYGPQFSAEVQLFAADDYVVFYPNPRGSTGYGEAFADALYHDYPGDDYHDVMAGVDAVIAAGGVHPDSLYVTGAERRRAS